MKVQMRAIIEAACGMAGFDTQYQEIPVRWRVMAATAVNEGLRRIHAEKFPTLQRVEFRRYRPTETDLEQAKERYAEGQECWSGDAYWRLVDGEWRRLTMEETNAFIAFEQPWEATEIDPAGVVLDECVYETDVKYHPKATPIRGCNWSLEGIQLPSPAPKGVYVRFVPKAPRIDFREWSEDKAYAKGSGCYVAADGDCYVTMRNVAAGEECPADNEAWKQIRIRDEFETYLTEMAAAAILTEDQGRYQTKAAAETAFQELQARFAEGTGDSRIRVGRFRR